MTFEEYQREARKTAVYPNIGSNFIYPVLGLSGESGEVAEKIKKVIRDSNGTVTESIRNDLIKELGDVLWYLSNLAAELNISLEVIAEENIKKLRSRQVRGVLKGNGDNR